MALNIEVNADYRITSDSLNVIVNRKYIVDPTKSPNWKKREAEGADPTPREEWREVAYVTGIDRAIKWIMNQRIRESEAANLTQLLDEIKRFEREIKAILPS
ncbi:hypothetical protein [Neobacillus mesonae]|uniref:Uncharacterized protein n=1 Tax=Neobacillus mesonae TaxID=1193713 RepID=A0A3T0HVC4_9BACI|nr:hypothetical protein [Neobacillus mesonae]AZU61013.1 hypothetical protein CHR53_06975 [Neobacillus mesonae]